MGYFGKRVGKWFTGLDDINIFFFNSPTSFQHWGLTRNGWFYKPETLNQEALVHKNYFTEDPYVAYLSRDLPMRIVKNNSAPNHKKLLVLGDSFHKPWQYFINTQFQEVYSLDLRHYSDGTLAEFITQTHPDIVVMVVSSRSWFEKLWNFGIESYEKILSKTNKTERPIVIKRAEVLSPGEIKSKFTLLDFDPEPGNTYTLTVDSTKLSGKQYSFVQMTLQNLTFNKPVINRYFDADSNKIQRWIFTVPNKPKEAFGLYLYAGTSGSTQHSSAFVEGITIAKGIHESESRV